MSLKKKALLKIADKGYYFDRDNNLRNPKGKPLIYKYINGYPAISVNLKGKNRRKFVLVTLHRLKAYFKYGDKIFQPGIEVRHLNGNKLDWSDKNIAIGTSSDNKQDIKPELRRKYAKNAAKKVRKFSDKEAKEIRKKRAEGVKYKELCEEYGVSKSTISYIINNVYYKIEEK